MATFSIKSGERQQLKSLQSRAMSAGRKLQDAVEEYNAVVTSAFAELKQKADDYNEVIQALNQECSDIRTQISDAHDSRSEAWQESDKGDAFRSWLEDWDIDFDEVDFDEPDELEFDMDQASQVYDLMPDWELDY